MLKLSSVLDGVVPFHNSFAVEQSRVAFIVKLCMLLSHCADCAAVQAALWLRWGTQLS